MKLQRIFILLTFLGLVISVINSQESAQFYCGRNLAITLATLCENGLMVKRTEPNNYNALAPRGWPWLEPHKSRSLERGKRQVVSECCDKPCTTDELMNYCAY